MASMEEIVGAMVQTPPGNKEALAQLHKKVRLCFGSSVLMATPLLVLVSNLASLFKT